MNIEEAEEDVEVTQEVSGEVNNKNKKSSYMVMEMLADVRNLLLKNLWQEKKVPPTPE